MKLGCICGCFNRAFDAGSMDQLRFLDHCARDLRVAGAELQDIHFPETRPPYRQRLRRAAGDLGLALIGIGVHNDFGRADTTWRQSEIVKVKQWVEVATDIGAPQVRVFAGHPEGTVTERWPAMIAALREAATFAAAAGVRLVLENEAGFTRNAKEHLRIVEEVGHPALRPLLDTGNYPDGWRSVEEAAPHAVHVHAKFWQVDPSGAEPTMNYPALLAALRGRRYDGWITFEYEAAEDESTGIPRALGYLRPLVTTG
ncbi:MAG TPA: sugar phosphate isomerase/epimerase family protein [Methylomirabilota bacterium]|jgi:sugar phosphate isomerase/epimerase|nr:sugar phosphate isomerase/epimerase family protein [Methylomirabilota bacterium]